jgi:hypothetical protein
MLTSIRHRAAVALWIIVLPAGAANAQRELGPVLQAAFTHAAQAIRDDDAKVVGRNPRIVVNSKIRSASRAEPFAIDQTAQAQLRAAGAEVTPKGSVITCQPVPSICRIDGAGAVLDFTIVSIGDASATVDVNVSRPVPVERRPMFQETFRYTLKLVTGKWRVVSSVRTRVT